MSKTNEAGLLVIITEICKLYEKVLLMEFL